MKKLLEVFILSLLLAACSSTKISKISFDKIKKIENKNYIIVAFESYQSSTDTRFVTDITNYMSVENMITDHCKKHKKNTYKTSHSWEEVKFTYGNGIKGYGQRFWCAKSLKEAGELYKGYLKEPRDEYLSKSQKVFKENSVRWIKQGKMEWIQNSIFQYHERSGLSLYGKEIVKSKTKKTKAKKSKEKSVESSSGTAFFVDNNGHIITNYHVIEKCNDKSKIIFNGEELPVKLVAKDRYLDLALLKVDIKNENYISISDKAPKKLQQIIAAGYPFGKYLSDDLKFTSGIISSLKGVDDDSTRLQIDAALNPGNSGGPIINQDTGHLVAVAVAGLRKDMTESVNFGIKAGQVKVFLESNQIETIIENSVQSISEVLETATIYTFCN